MENSLWGCYYNHVQYLLDLIVSLNAQVLKAFCVIIEKLYLPVSSSANGMWTHHYMYSSDFIPIEAPSSTPLDMKETAYCINLHLKLI